MDGMLQADAMRMENLRLLAYVQHMAQTAESEEARRIFMACLEAEARRCGLQRLDAQPAHQKPVRNVGGDLRAPILDGLCPVR
jgi:hypothetical protein